ncbi:hypothetical protein BA173_01660 [Rickettsia sp. MEAM1 (Bemisia tabaci)]|uniref:hypothetical protein n=1 Tax=Rickettsia sp. MEAM1 (Bemisia tabaci) TaxID=1182263 RepID=UPI000BAB21A4|nr:hypothetical protein BA173_01660 [Rickettsia sp. MEAM1 (Bemisia tabaci)]
MHITQAPNRHRFPASIISHTVWLYHRFNNSYRDVQEQMAYRGIILSHETVRFWCYKFVVYFQDVISKRERKPTDGTVKLSKLVSQSTIFLDFRQQEVFE